MVETYDRIQVAFPGTQSPAVVAVQRRRRERIGGPPRDRRTSQPGARERADGQPDQGPREPRAHRRRHRGPLRGNGDDAASQAALRTLREEIVPETVGKVPGIEAAVTGETAGSSDFNQQMKSRAPLVIGFVLFLAFLLLLVTFRSIVIPLKAIVLNLLSAGAAYGVLVCVFQGLGREAARLPLKRRDRLLASALPLRRPLRPLDGLPRLHPQPRQGARRRRHEDRGGGRAGDHPHRRNRDQRRNRHGRCLRHLRHAATNSTSSRWASASPSRS